MEPARTVSYLVVRARPRHGPHRRPRPPRPTRSTRLQCPAGHRCSQHDLERPPGMPDGAWVRRARSSQADPGPGPGPPGRGHGAVARGRTGRTSRAPLGPRQPRPTPSWRWRAMTALGRIVRLPGLSQGWRRTRAGSPSSSPGPPAESYPSRSSQTTPLCEHLLRPDEAEEAVVARASSSSSAATSSAPPSAAYSPARSPVVESPCPSPPLHPLSESLNEEPQPALAASLQETLVRCTSLSRSPRAPSPSAATPPRISPPVDPGGCGSGTAVGSSGSDGEDVVTWPEAGVPTSPSHPQSHREPCVPPGPGMRWPLPFAPFGELGLEDSPEDSPARGWQGPSLADNARDVADILRALDEVGEQLDDTHAQRSESSRSENLAEILAADPNLTSKPIASTARGDFQTTELPSTALHNTASTAPAPGCRKSSAAETTVPKITDGTDSSLLMLALRQDGDHSVLLLTLLDKVTAPDAQELARLVKDCRSSMEALQHALSTGEMVTLAASVPRVSLEQGGAHEHNLSTDGRAVDIQDTVAQLAQRATTLEQTARDTSPRASQAILSDSIVSTMVEVDRGAEGVITDASNDDLGGDADNKPLSPHNSVGLVRATGTDPGLDEASSQPTAVEAVEPCEPEPQPGPAGPASGTKQPAAPPEKIFSVTPAPEHTGGNLLPGLGDVGRELALLANLAGSRKLGLAGDLGDLGDPGDQQSSASASFMPGDKYRSVPLGCAGAAGSRSGVATLEDARRRVLLQSRPSELAPLVGLPGSASKSQCAVAPPARLRLQRAGVVAKPGVGPSTSTEPATARARCCRCPRRGPSAASASASRVGGDHAEEGCPRVRPRGCRLASLCDGLSEGLSDTLAPHRAACFARVAHHHVAHIATLQREPAGATGKAAVAAAGHRPQHLSRTHPSRGALPRAAPVAPPSLAGGRLAARIRGVPPPPGHGPGHGPGPALAAPAAPAPATPALRSAKRPGKALSVSFKEPVG